MIRSLNTAENAMLLEQNRIDALANNLANVNTAGFKQILTRVAEVTQQSPLGTQIESASVNSPDPTRAPVLQMYHALDNRPGNVQATGRETDVAIIGRGYFEVQTPNGLAYTRHGSFLLDAEQGLTTPGGLQVIGASVPLAEMFGYTTNLRSMTQGRGTHTMHFSTYYETPKSVSDAVIARITGMASY